MSALLEVAGLGLDVVPRRGDRLPLLHDVSLSIGVGESLGLVGESGSGKSLTARCVAGLAPRGAVRRGVIRVDGRDLAELDAGDLRRLRADDVAMIFQDPRAHVNPVRTVEDHVTEPLRYLRSASRRSARARALELLESVLIADPGDVLRRYPHELSGGMLQRVMIAGALASEPRLLLADEPTTALDVTTQAEVVAILGRLRAEHGMAMLFITHDLALAAAISDRTAVMYAGTIVEEQESRALEENPRHPYTAALQAARPSLTARAARLTTIPGSPATAAAWANGCAFADRCPRVEGDCRELAPGRRPLGADAVACHHAEVPANAATSGAEGDLRG